MLGNNLVIIVGMKIRIQDQLTIHLEILISDPSFVIANYDKDKIIFKSFF